MIITIAHQKGGVGKSTIATNLAVTLKTDLFDLDKQFSSAEFNNTRMEAGLQGIACYTLLEGGCETPNQTPIKHADLVDFLLEYSGKPDKNIIIDCPGFDCDEVRASLYCADYILTPVAASQVEVYGLQNFEKIIEDTEEEYGKSIHSHVLINNADSRAKKRTEELKEFVAGEGMDHFILCKARLSRAMAFWDAYAEGMSVMEYKGGRRNASAELRNLAWEISNELGMEGE